MIVHRFLGAALASLFAVTTTVAQPAPPAEGPLADALKAFEARSYEHEGMTLPYRLLSPSKVDEGERYPLVLFLHGYGERGAENWRQLIHGGTTFASPELRQRYPAYVVAPQCPDGTEPGTVSVQPEDPPGTEAQRVWTWRLKRGDSPAIELDRSPTHQLTAVMRLVDALCAEFPVDRDRLYVGGLSMGGYATWELVTREPQRWAAALPICGAGDPTHAARLSGLPVWVVHGDADSAIPVERSREMVAALRAAGGRVVYSELPGVDHDSWTPAFQNRATWDWLFAQRR